MKKYFIIILILIAVVESSCSNEKANETFGDSNFKVSIALIELYNKRNGNYPDSLGLIPYTFGQEIQLNSVRYKKLKTGYKLDLVIGHLGFPKNLSYPDEFWQGLGCVESNLKRRNQ